MTVTVVDYGLGNIFSVLAALRHLNQEVVVDHDGSTIPQSSLVVIPGVGAFGEGVRALRARGQFSALDEFGRRGGPLIGFCLGAQLLLNRSEESPGFEGLGLVKGAVRALTGPGQVNPNQGWSIVDTLGLADYPVQNASQYFYFSHSYECKPEPDSSVRISTTYAAGQALTAWYRTDRIIGLQFHPERSGEVGLRCLRSLLNSLQN